MREDTPEAPKSDVAEGAVSDIIMENSSTPFRKPPQSARPGEFGYDPLLTVEEVALRLHVSRDWVWDHSSRKTPHLPVIRMGDGALRYRSSAIEEFINERERLSNLHRKRR